MLIGQNRRFREYIQQSLPNPFFYPTDIVFGKRWYTTLENYDQQQHHHKPVSFHGYLHKLLYYGHITAKGSLTLSVIEFHFEAIFLEHYSPIPLKSNFGQTYQLSVTE